MSLNNINFFKITEIKPEEVRSYFIQEVGEKAELAAYNFLKDLNRSYPNFRNWFYEKVVSDLEKGNNKREIIFAIAENEENKKVIAALAILKKSNEERKICTFRVHENFRSQGLGKYLFEECFNFLETNKPVISISSETKPMFEPLIEAFDFILVEELPNYYQKDITEYVYNGNLK